MFPILIRTIWWYLSTIRPNEWKTLLIGHISEYLPFSDQKGDICTSNKGKNGRRKNNLFYGWGK